LESRVGMPGLPERIVADLKLRGDSDVLIFGEPGEEVVSRIASVVEGPQRVVILYRGLSPPSWARTFSERGVRVLRSHLYEHNDFLATSSFDSILAGNVLDKVLGKSELLAETYRLLKPGGRTALIQKLWPASRLRKPDLLRLVERARSYSLVRGEFRLMRAYIILEKGPSS
jgi:SAM-dependent methyltransferase